MASSKKSPAGVADFILPQDPLFYSDVLLGFIKKAQKKKNSTSNGSLFNLKLPLAVADGLLAFLRTGDLTRLPDLLTKHPGVLGHPSISQGIEHLAFLVQSSPSSEARAFASTILTSSIKAYSERLLPGKKLLIFQTRQRGRKRKYQWEDELEYLYDFQELIKALGNLLTKYTTNFPPEFRKKKFWKPFKGETEKKFFGRMEGVLNDLISESFYKTWGHTLSSDKARSIIKKAIRGKSTVDPQYLLYAFMGDYDKKPPDEIRGVIYRCQKNNDMVIDFKASLYPNTTRFPSRR